MYGYTAISITECLLILIFDFKDGKSGRTPLHYAVEMENMATIQLLINSGANVSAASYAGSTPIQAASGRGMHEVTRLLLGSINEAACKSTSTSNQKVHEYQHFKQLI